MSYDNHTAVGILIMCAPARESADGAVFPVGPALLCTQSVAQRESGLCAVTRAGSGPPPARPPGLSAPPPSFSWKSATASLGPALACARLAGCSVPPAAKQWWTGNFRVGSF